MEFERADLLALLGKLAIRLNELGIQGTFRIVGGAAIALKYSERPPTHDIDAEFISSNGSQDEIRQVIEEIARSEGLTPGWLNEFAMIFLPSHTSEDWVEFQQIGNIRFVVASAPLLLAMKLRAIRGDRDSKDIIALLKLVRFLLLQTQRRFTLDTTEMTR